MKAFISTTTFGKYNKEPLSLLRNKGIRHIFNPYKRRLSEDEIYNILKKDSFSGLLAGTEPLTKDVLENAKSLRVISRVGIGLENIDLDTAARLNIKVYNTPYVLTDSVSELTIALILSSLRKIISMDKNMRSNVWNKEMGELFRNKTLGIIGFGKIGKRVAQLAKAFKAKIIYFDSRPLTYRNFTQVSLSRLLRDSDIISIHASSREQLITKKEISKMKKGIILINTSRGSIIDEDALYKALKDRKVAYAALDVHSYEPYSGKLTRLDNVILTPHIGSYAREARIEMEKEAAKNLIKGLREVNLL